MWFILAVADCSGVRANGNQPKLYVPMILILIFAEVMGKPLHLPLRLALALVWVVFPFCCGHLIDFVCVCWITDVHRSVRLDYCFDLDPSPSRPVRSGLVSTAYFVFLQPPIVHLTSYMGRSLVNLSLYLIWRPIDCLTHPHLPLSVSTTAGFYT